MKVRWTSGSVRFRITPGELAALLAGEAVTAHLPLPGSGGWRATLRPEPGGASPTRLYGDGGGRLTLHLAAADLSRLSDPAAEGVYFRGPLGDGEGEPDGMRFFVEKDFPCVHPRPPEAQEHTDTFAPPPGFSERHKTGHSC